MTSTTLAQVKLSACLISSTELPLKLAMASLPQGITATT